MAEAEDRVRGEWESKLEDSWGEWNAKVEAAERRAKEVEAEAEAARREVERLEMEGEEERGRYEEMIDSLKAGLQSEMDRYKKIGNCHLPTFL